MSAFQLAKLLAEAYKLLLGIVLQFCPVICELELDFAYHHANHLPAEHRFPRHPGKYSLESSGDAGLGDMNPTFFLSPAKPKKLI